MLSADVRHDYVQTHITRTEQAHPDAILSVYQGMESQGGEQLLREGFSRDSIVMLRSADMRYPRQAYELSVPVEGGDLPPEALSEAASRFHALHEKTYGYARRSEPVEFVNLRLTAMGKLPPLPQREEKPADNPPPDPTAWREVTFDGHKVNTPVYQRDQLAPGTKIHGPAVLEQLDSTVLVPPDCRAARDRYGNLRIRLQTGDGS